MKKILSTVVSLFCLVLFSCDFFSDVILENHTPYTIEIHVMSTYSWPIVEIYNDSGAIFEIPENGEYYTGYLDSGKSLIFLTYLRGIPKLEMSSLKNDFERVQDERNFDFFLIIQDGEKTRIDITDIFDSEYVYVERESEGIFEEFIIHIVEP